MTRFHLHLSPFSLLGLSVSLILSLGFLAEKGLTRPISADEVPPLPVSEGSSLDLEGVISPNPQWWFLGRGGAFSAPSETISGYELSGDYYVITTEKLNITLENLGSNSENLGSQQGDTSRATRRFPFALF
ncbi:MAG: hypothetical protein AB4041_11775 [Microcystaceae cyanobacterium]